MNKNNILKLILIILATGLYFIANLQRVAVPGTIFDLLQNDLKTNAASITALSASFMYFYSFCQLLVGFFVAKYGGIKVLNIGAIIFSLGGIIFPFTNNLFILYLSRALIGIGSSTFYLGMISELQKIVSHNNFGIFLSLMLFIGYIGGIIAGAPILITINEYGWQNSFLFIGMITLFITIFFVSIQSFLPKQKKDTNIKFNITVYKKVLFNKANLKLYTFGCLNYAIYFVFQTVLGKKFLEDFTQISSMKAALILSIMGVIYAFSGPLLAFLSKILLNRRAIFFKVASINTLFIMCLFLFFIICEIKSEFIGILFLMLSLFASMSPLLIPIVYDLSNKKEASISISIMTSLFFFIVAILSNTIGGILLYFTPDNSMDKALIYPDIAYIFIFIIMIALAFVSLFCAWQIKDTKLTLRYLRKIKSYQAKF